MVYAHLLYKLFYGFSFHSPLMGQKYIFDNEASRIYGSYLVTNYVIRYKYNAPKNTMYLF